MEKLNPVLQDAEVYPVSRPYLQNLTHLRRKADQISLLDRTAIKFWLRGNPSC